MIRLTDEEMLERAVQEAKYIIKEKCTLKEAGEVFHLSDTTVRNDLYRLARRHPVLFRSVRAVIEENKKLARPKKTNDKGEN